jgi:hypothetical protein
MTVAEFWESAGLRREIAEAFTHRDPFAVRDFPDAP